jgi:hypothetical protein
VSNVLYKIMKWLPTNGLEVVDTKQSNFLILCVHYLNVCDDNSVFYIGFNNVNIIRCVYNVILVG